MDSEPVDDHARMLLEQLGKSANLSTGVEGLQWLDWEKFHEFIIYAHTQRFDIRDEEVRDRLFALPASETTAKKLTSYYYHSRELLRFYDDVRPHLGR